MDCFLLGHGWRGGDAPRLGAERTCQPLCVLLALWRRSDRIPDQIALWRNGSACSGFFRPLRLARCDGPTSRCWLRFNLGHVLDGGRALACGLRLRLRLFSTHHPGGTQVRPSGRTVRRDECTLDWDARIPPLRRSGLAFCRAVEVGESCLRGRFVMVGWARTGPSWVCPSPARFLTRTSLRWRLIRSRFSVVPCDGQPGCPVLASLLRQRPSVPRYCG